MRCSDCGATGECFSNCQCSKCQSPEEYEDWKRNCPEEYAAWLEREMELQRNE